MATDVVADGCTGNDDREVMAGALMSLRSPLSRMVDRLSLGWFGEHLMLVAHRGEVAD